MNQGIVDIHGLVGHASDGMTPLVCVVDDDESVRESLPDLLRSFGLPVRAFSSAERFLASDCVGRASCLILDVSMPGMSGPELERELKVRESGIPIVFITAHGAEDGREQILKNGAVDCLAKPFSEASLMEAVRKALSLAGSRQAEVESSRLGKSDVSHT